MLALPDAQDPEGASGIQWGGGFIGPEPAVTACERKTQAFMLNSHATPALLPS